VTASVEISEGCELRELKMVEMMIWKFYAINPTSVEISAGQWLTQVTEDNPIDESQMKEHGQPLDTIGIVRKAMPHETKR